MASIGNYSQDEEEGPASSGAAGTEVEPRSRYKPVKEFSMSSITKLMIQGIRGFGAGDEQKGVIEFGKPLTLITGQNGAGKTTIIECLKYATTGDLPPNSKGGAFVHDPKLVNERSVRGVVKLKFQNISGCSVVCHRMLQSTQKPRKIEQKTIDSSLEKILPDGQKVKITTRCAEIDREMIDQLGVSKPILSHVIFCHQEDSAWPLGEGKALKSKFDDIFASTRYTKALENFKKIQQELMSDIKIYKAELHHLQKQKEKVDEVKKDLQEAQQKVENSKTEITRINNELTPMEDRFQDLTGKYDEVTRIEKEMTKHDSSKQEMMKSQRQLESSIETVFAGTKTQLQDKRDQHQSLVERNTAELEEVRRQLKQLFRSMEGMKDTLDDCHREHGRLKTEEQYHKERINSRDGKIITTASQLSFPGYDRGPFHQSKVAQFLAAFLRFRKEKEEKIKIERQQLIDMEHDAQKELDKLRTNLAKIEESIEMKEVTVRKNRINISEITRELAAIGSGAAALDGVEQDLISADKELSDYKEQVDLSLVEEEVEKLSQEKQRVKYKVQHLQKELSQISLQSSARGAIEELKKQQRSKEETYQLELESLEPELLSLLGEIPSSGENLTLRLREVVKRKEKEKQNVDQQYSKGSGQVSRLQAQLEGLEKQLVDKKTKTEALQLEVSTVCGEDTTNSYQELVDTLQTQMETASENMATVKGSQSFFRKSLEKLHTNHKCPLCMRGFEDEPSLNSTIKLITTRLNDAIPRMIPRLNNELHQLQDKQRQLQELKPKIEDLSCINSQEIPHLKKLKDEKRTEIAGVRASLDREREKQGTLYRELEHIRSLQPKVVKVSQLKEQLSELDNKINTEEAKLGHLSSGHMSSGHSQPTQRSHHVVNRELQEAQRNEEELNQKMDHKRQEITDTQRIIRQLEAKVHALKEEKLERQARLQKRETLLSKKKDLTTLTETLDREIKMESKRVSPVRDKMEELAMKKQEKSHEREEVETENRTQIEELRTSYEGIKNTSNTINKYIRDGKDKAMEEYDEKVTRLTSQMESKENQKKGLEEKIASLTEQLANVKNKERELADNLQLLKLQEEIKQRMRKMTELKDLLRGMGLEAYDDEFQRLKNDITRLHKEQALAEGREIGQEDQVRHLRRELQSELYAGVEDRYMDMLIKLKTTETACKDLGKYYKALDRAIMRFHSVKMQEINYIIKELWIKTYKGGDIDTIEIRSDDCAQSDSTTAAAASGASISSRKVYNYRVVMIKGNVELDMRGRCSAGQKVLASIIIRLALAETFCLTSGLLALDEPTTNLDRDNVEGLAQALTDIVKARSKNQKNFQLVIITHDEAFVELLGHTGYTDCFYKVTKNFGETSSIKRYYF